MTPALHACIGQLQDVIPADIARTYALTQQDYALQNIHQPTDAAALTLARKRLVFEELFVLSTAMGNTRLNRSLAIFFKIIISLYFLLHTPVSNKTDMWSASDITIYKNQFFPEDNEPNLKILRDLKIPD